MKAGITTSLILLMLGIGVTEADAASVTLYNGTSPGGLPSSQGWLAPGALRNVGGFPVPVTPSETVVSGGVQVDTTANSAEYSGYSNYNPLTSSFINPAFPSLNRTLGYTVTFNATVNSSTNNVTNRAGFNVLVVSNDNFGIELGFKPNSIFGQSSNFSLVPPESTSFNTTSSTTYDLTVLGGNYQLFANGTPILSGTLRTYSFNPATSSPPLPFNPYTTPNFLFFGDDTGQESATFTLSSAAITTNNAAGVPFGFSPVLGLIVVGAWGGVYQWRKQRESNH